ncbi:MAG: fructose-bisphosphate aldolase, partial [Gammaproteobacteria bacterium]|nr:fructose-bisphosphate aldolase [Gammaproteobacteria bacterium]
EGTVLKASMVLSGKDCPRQAAVGEVAERTVACLRNTVPAAVPGVVFLSGGQTAVQSTEHLNAMNAAGVDLPWRLSFSYGRALQEPALTTWAGDAGNVASAQRRLALRARLNGAATLGRYRAEMEAA